MTAKRTGVVAYVTKGFFHLAGVSAHRGRFFSEDEDIYGAPINVAVLSHAYWNRALGADSAVLGTKIRVDTTLFTVVGIAPPRFEGMDLDAVDVWVPLASYRSREGPWWNGKFGVMELFVRLPRGADEQAATNRFTVALRRADPEASQRDPTLRVEVSPLLQARSAIGLGSQSDRNLALTIRLAGVGLLVLVIAMSNVASLLLMRALKRRREIAIRIALGVSRGRLAGQMLIESLLLALVGAAVAVLIAFVTGEPLRRALLSTVQWSASVIDTRLVVFTALLGVVVGSAAGILPAIVGLGDDVLAALKSGSSESGRARSGVRVSLLVSQTALCMLMLAAAGMFVQTLRKARDFDLGFDTDRLVTLYAVGLPRDLLEPVVARIRTLPSVLSVGGSDADLHGSGMLGPVVLANGDSIPQARVPFFATFDPAYASCDRHAHSRRPRILGRRPQGRRARRRDQSGDGR